MTVEISQLVPYAISALSAGAGWAAKSLIARRKEQTAVKGGVVALIHDRLYGIYGECAAAGFASVETVRNVDYLYHPYHALGGNGTGTELYNRIKSMPPAPPKSPVPPEEKE